jgi:hypothetical protein
VGLLRRLAPDHCARKAAALLDAAAKAFEPIKARYELTALLDDTTLIFLE